MIEAATDDSIGVPANDSDVSAARIFGAGMRAAFALFAIAGLAGALFRFVVAYGWNTGLDPVNIRHAHSHLMYFGWATPALFVLIGAFVSGRGGRPPSARLLAWTVGLAFVTAAAFLPWGYAPATIGSARIPITILLSTACMGAWYAWIAWYRRSRAAIRDEPARPLADAAVIFLGLSTLGAWFVAALVPFGEEGAALKVAFAHLFLQYFSEGWFTLGLMAVAWTRLDRRVQVPSWALSLSVGGIALGFLLSLPSTMMDDRMQMIARLAGIAHGAGMLGLAWTWWRHAPAKWRGSWGVPVLILAAKGATQTGALLVPGIWWADLLPVRILYLHLLLLGFVSMAIAASTLRGAWLGVFQVAALAVVLSLVPFTRLWPFSPPGLWALESAAWLSIAPAAVALVALVAGKVGGRPEDG